MKFIELTNKTLSAQVREAVPDIIRKSELMDRLPSEQDLAVQLGVNGNTVRGALKGLENEGLVTSRHGIDTPATRYNSSENIRHNISALDSTTKIISEHGYVSGIQSAPVDVRMVGPETPKRLDSDIPVKVLYIERIRTADGTPIVSVEDHIPYMDGTSEDSSLYAIPSLLQFINRYAPVPFVNCSIHAVLSNKRQMDRLSLTDPKVLLLLQQTHHLSKGSPIPYSDSHFITRKLEFNLIRRCVEQTQMGGPD